MQLYGISHYLHYRVNEYDNAGELFRYQ